jgi:hypothetical protein
MCCEIQFNEFQSISSDEYCDVKYNSQLFEYQATAKEIKKKFYVFGNTSENQKKNGILGNGS